VLFGRHRQPQPDTTISDLPASLPWPLPWIPAQAANARSSDVPEAPETIESGKATLKDQKTASPVSASASNSLRLVFSAGLQPLPQPISEGCHPWLMLAAIWLARPQNRNRKQPPFALPLLSRLVPTNATPQVLVLHPHAGNSPCGCRSLQHLRQPTAPGAHSAIYGGADFPWIQIVS